MIDPRHASPDLAGSSEPPFCEPPDCQPQGGGADRRAAVEEHPAAGRQRWLDRRETRTISRALERVPNGAHVLDLSSEAGSHLGFLATRGFRVTCDRSNGRATAPRPDFKVREVLETSYPDEYFDAIVCNRLFHVLPGSDIRIHALTELRRISRGPVVLSFFNAFALGAFRSHLRRALRQTAPLDSIPVPAWRLLNDIRRSGLTPVSLHSVAWGISPLWHVVSVPTCGRSLGASRRSGRRTAAG